MRQKRRAREGLELDRWTAGLRISALECARDAEQEMFVGDGADELKADGQAAGSEAAREAKSRNACKIGRAIVAQEQCPSGMVDAIY